MAALVATTPSRTGTVSAPGAAVAASDTIAASILGSRGAHLEIVNAGAGTDNITISDAGSSPAGTPVTSYAATVANAGVGKVFLISPKQVDPATQVVTITHSQPTGVTYKLFPIG
jgi:hypothetical protein